MIVLKVALIPVELSSPRATTQVSTKAHMLGTALLCGKNEILLDTRARLLKSVDIDSVRTQSVNEFEQVSPHIHFGLVVLAQSLTNEEVEVAVTIVRRRWPDAKFLIFHRVDQLREDIPGCAYLTTLGPPAEFITKAVELLTKGL